MFRAEVVKRKVPITDAAGKTAEDATEDATEDAAKQSTVYATDYFVVFDPAKPIAVPDERYRMTLDYHPNNAADDDVKVTIDSNGYLAGATTTFSDRSFEIVAKIVEQAVSLSKLALLGGMGPSGLIAKSSNQDATYELVESFVFDPLVPDTFQGTLARYGLTMEVRGTPGCGVVAPGTPCIGQCVGRQPGLCYRPLQSFVVYANAFGVPISINGAPHFDLRMNWASPPIMLPNAAPIYTVPISRASGVASFTEVVFEEGILTSYATRKPSELLAFFTAADGVLKSLLTLPTLPITVKTEYYGQISELSRSEMGAIEALEELRLLRESIANEREEGGQ